MAKIKVRWDRMNMGVPGLEVVKESPGDKLKKQREAVKKAIKKPKLGY